MTAYHWHAYLVLDVTLPYRGLVGNPGLDTPGTMSGFKCEVKLPGVHVKPPVVSDVFRTRCEGVVCRFGGEMKS